MHNLDGIVVVEETSCTCQGMPFRCLEDVVWASCIYQRMPLDVLHMSEDIIRKRLAYVRGHHSLYMYERTLLRSVLNMLESIVVVVIAVIVDENVIVSVGEASL